MVNKPRLTMFLAVLGLILGILVFLYGNNLCQQLYPPQWTRSILAKVCPAGSTQASTTTPTEKLVLKPSITPQTQPGVAEVELTLNVVGWPETGSIRFGAPMWVLKNVGDTQDNYTTQVFFSFDISSIPAGSTIIDVTLDLSDFDTLGNPFIELGCLSLFNHDFGILDPDDFIDNPSTMPLIRVCDLLALSKPISGDTFVTSLQVKVGSKRYQLRAQFADMSVSPNDQADMVRFGTILMTITYYH